MARDKVFVAVATEKVQDAEYAFVLMVSDSGLAVPMTPRAIGTDMTTLMRHAVDMYCERIEPTDLPVVDGFTWSVTEDGLFAESAGHPLQEGKQMSFVVSALPTAKRAS